MSDEQTAGNNIVPVETNTALQSSSSLLSRGLNDLDNRKFTLEDIRKAQAEREELSGLTAEAVLLVLERPSQWRARLFLQIVDDEIKKYMQAHYSGLLQVDSNQRPLQIINKKETLDWGKSKMIEIKAVTSRMKQAFEQFFASVNPSGEAAVLIESAINMSLIYHHLWEWQIKVETTVHDSELDRLFEAFCQIAFTLRKDLEDYISNSIKILHEALSGKMVVTSVDLTFTPRRAETAYEVIVQEVERVAFL